MTSNIGLNWPMSSSAYWSIGMLVHLGTIKAHSISTPECIGPKEAKFSDQDFRPRCKFHPTTDFIASRNDFTISRSNKP